MSSPFSDPKQRIAFFQQWFSDTIPHNKALGLKVLSVRRGLASMQLEWREELVGINEIAGPSRIDKIHRVTGRTPPDPDFFTALEKIERQAAEGDVAAVRADEKDVAELEVVGIRPDVQPVRRVDSLVTDAWLLEHRQLPK